MGIYRRTSRPSQAPAEPVVLGELRMRRVWLRADPRGKTDNEGKHWYVPARSKVGAINDMARRTRQPAAIYDSEPD